MQETQPLDEGMVQKAITGLLILSSTILGARHLTSLDDMTPAESAKVEATIERLPDSTIEQKTGVSKETAKKILKAKKSKTSKKDVKPVKQGAVSAQVKAQMDAVRAFTGPDEKPTYMILDDKKDLLHIIKGDTVSKTMSIITGSDKGDVLAKKNFYDWLKDEKGFGNAVDQLKSGKGSLVSRIGDLETEYLDDYVAAKVTPSGYYIVSYDMMKSLLMTTYSKRDYGDGYLRIQRTDGSELLNAMHGTANPVRLKALSDNKDGNRNLSYGCANLKAEDIETVLELAKDQNVATIILPDDGKSVVDLNSVDGLSPDDVADPDATGTWAGALAKAVSVLVGFTLIWKRRKLFVADGLGDDTTSDEPVANPDPSTKPEKKPLDPRIADAVDSAEDRLKRATVDIPAAINQKIEDILSTLNQPERQEQSLKWIQRLMPSVKNTYINMLIKQYDPSTGRALRQQRYKKGSMVQKTIQESQVWWQSVIDRKTGAVEQKIDAEELELSGELGSIVNKARKYVASGKPLSPKAIEYIQNKARESARKFLDVLNQFVNARISAYQEITGSEMNEAQTETFLMEILRLH